LLFTGELFFELIVGVNDDQSVSDALKEISGNQILRNVLEKMIGLNPAVVEITAITAAFGADSQGWVSLFASS
jgi:hypothetical protein